MGTWPSRATWRQPRRSQRRSATPGHLEALFYEAPHSGTRSEVWGGDPRSSGPRRCAQPRSLPCQALPWARPGLSEATSGAGGEAARRASSALRSRPLSYCPVPGAEPPELSPSCSSPSAPLNPFSVSQGFAEASQEPGRGWAAALSRDGSPGPAFVFDPRVRQSLAHTGGGFPETDRTPIAATGAPNPNPQLPRGAVLNGHTQGHPDSSALAVIVALRVLPSPSLGELQVQGLCCTRVGVTCRPVSVQLQGS